MARRTTRSKTRTAKPRKTRPKPAAKSKAAKSLPNRREDGDKRRRQAPAASAKGDRGAIVFESIADGVMILDGDWCVEAVNRAYTQITGYAESDVIGRLPVFLAQKKTGARLIPMIAKICRASGSRARRVTSSSPKSAQEKASHPRRCRCSNKA